MARTLLIMLLLQFSNLPFSMAQDSSILVLFPEVDDPYRKAYEQIIEGLRSSGVGSLHSQPISKGQDFSKTQRWIDEHESSAKYLVTLGGRALQASGHLRHELRIIASAIDILPGDYPVSGVSIFIHPEIYLEYLTTLSPQINQLVLYYNKKDESIIEIVEKEAYQRGIEVTPISVINIETAILQITDMLKGIDPKTTAIWFTHNVIEFNTELLYPYILEESWNRRILVFSSMVSHTKRGFLFSLYPDYQGVGKEIGQLISEHELHDDAIVVRYTRAAKFALNTRTAQRLGLIIDNKTLKIIDVKFPAW
jgi:putative ABC transport system substrate-binding protein